MVQQFRDGLPAMEKTSRHLCNGPARQPERGVLSCSATIPMRPPAHGIIGRLTIFRRRQGSLADDAAQTTKMKQAVHDFREGGYGRPPSPPRPPAPPSSISP